MPDPYQQTLYHPEFEHDACGVGFIARTTGRAGHDIVQMALQAVGAMKHRSGIDADGRSGDGAGVMTQIPHRLLSAEIADLPQPGDYALGMLFLPRPETGDRGPETDRAIELVETTFNQLLETENRKSEIGNRKSKILWRSVPVNSAALGPTAQRSCPQIKQVIIPRPAEIERGLAFERFLYTARKRLEAAARQAGLADFYVVSLSATTVVYKGLMLSPYLADFYLDLANPLYETALATLHTRYSTNTTSNWQRAQPFRLVAHNGEINTIQGNVNWMRARESMLDSPFWPGHLDDLRPVIDPAGSDSAMLDNVLELLVHAGRDIHHSMAMLAPEAWENLVDLDPDRQAFYRYHAALMEPWDGPAAVVFSDGRRVGATLDRNGLRPMRYLTTNTDLVIATSEAGVVTVDEGTIVTKGKLGPGQMILVDLERQLFLTNDQVKNELARRLPYGEWVEGLKPVPTETRPAYFSLEPAASRPLPPKVNTTHQWLARLQAAFGYTHEELIVLVRPMADEGKEPTGSMGDDTPLAVMSPRARPLFHYFKQRFAQVTNPPIDPLRETFVMSLTIRLGAHPNLLEETPKHAHLVELASPVLSDADLVALKSLGDPRFAHHTIAMRYPVAQRADGLRRALDRLGKMAEDAIDAGKTILILSDLGINEQYAPIPSLLAVGAVHHHLVRRGKRMQVSLVVESGEAREVHHLACLIGYGANAVNPYLALASVEDLVTAGKVKLEVAEAKLNFVRALEAGLLKIMSKMGISTVDSYCGAQIFEAVGLGQPLIDEFFTGTVSRLGGIGLPEIAAEVQRWHRAGFADPQRPEIQSPGFYKYKREGETHAYDPAIVKALQTAVRMEGVLSGEASEQRPVISNQMSVAGSQRSVASSQISEVNGHHYVNGTANGQLITHNGHPRSSVPGLRSFLGPNFAAGYRAYQEFVQLTRQRPAIDPRHMFDFVSTGRPRLDLAEVEPLEALFVRFSTGAMSHGALSSEAHETLAIALNRLGAMSNSGEGGSAQERFGTEKNDRIKQVASGRFGVSPAYLMSSDELQIKMGQGAKPGEGGQLPGSKVTAEIAAIRHTTAGTTLISPPPHHDIYSIEDLAQLIYDLKQINPAAKVSVKLVAEAGVGTVAAGVVKGGADVVHIAGHAGGTGAAAWSSIKCVGLPWEVGLAETHQTLVLNDLRGRVKLRTDGGLQTGRDVVIAAILGADEFSFGTVTLVAEGCLLARACHSNTCPVGVATQDPKLRAKFAGTPEHVMAYLHYVAQEVREILAELGFCRLDEVIGRTELLRQVSTGNAMADTLDLSPLLAKADRRPETGDRGGQIQPSNLPTFQPSNLPTFQPSITALGDLNQLLLRQAQPALEIGEPVQLNLPIDSTDRAVGATLAGAIAQRCGDRGLPEGTVQVTFLGSAGQSFGAFNAPGVHLTLIGEANDYVGKGMAGGQIVVRPSLKSQLAAADHVIMGNTVLYGAIGGSMYVAGQAGERFAVRNSGAVAVVEGVGDHGCEYMTGGVVVVLGRTGYNFGAGMSGGLAFVLDEGHHLGQRLNPDMVQLVRVTNDQDAALLKLLITRHVRLTGSVRGQAILDNWTTRLALFWKVAPKGTIGATGKLLTHLPMMEELSRHVAG
ncbi:MAG: glutamate synthase subunit alpha [Anaerolineae bacterium]|nr:glutamate synthase subunit alpha [Anaerolineales bacterium]MCQ3977221.1 glutamate synthase subunit alpha [Anaerolineae bacterium]